MRLKDKNIGKHVLVLCRECIGFKCYWPRPDPGVFVQGKGYTVRPSNIKQDWVCGTREIQGCPDKEKR